MNKELKEKYEKLGWKFDPSGPYYKSPRMKEFLYFPHESDKYGEKDLLESEIEDVLALMRESLNDQFDKVCDGLLNQQRLLIKRGFPPEKVIKVSFDVIFE
jgi:hypothetical protein